MVQDVRSSFADVALGQDCSNVKYSYDPKWGYICLWGVLRCPEPRAMASHAVLWRTDDLGFLSQHETQSEMPPRIATKQRGPLWVYPVHHVKNTQCLPHLCSNAEGCNARWFGIWLRLAEIGTERSLVGFKLSVQLSSPPGSGPKLQV